MKAKKRVGFLSVMSWISISGILVGVMALVVALSFASGFQSALRDKLIGINAHLLLLHYDGHIEQWEEIREQLKEFSDIAITMPFTYRSALLRSSNNVSITTVRGILPEILPEISGPDLKFSCGSFSSLLSGSPEDQKSTPQSPPLLLGKALAENLKIECGDVVHMIALSQESDLKMGGTALRTYRVAGIFELGFYEYDASLALLALDQAQDFFGMENSVTGLEIQLKDMNETDRLEVEVQKALGYRFWLRSWKEIHINFFSALQLQKIVMFLVLILIILVGGFNIISTLIMNVIEKRREVSILKAMGATQGAIARIFFIQGFILGLLGTCFGLLFGYGVCCLAKKYPLIRLDPDIYFLSHLPVEIRPLEFFIVGISSLLLSVLATVYPAWQAARLDPAEVLRYE